MEVQWRSPLDFILGVPLNPLSFVDYLIDSACHGWVSYPLQPVCSGVFLLNLLPLLCVPVLEMRLS